MVCDIDLRFLSTFAKGQNLLEVPEDNAWRLLSGALNTINLVRVFNEVILVTKRLHCLFRK